MQGVIKKNHSDSFKFRVALEAIKGEKSIAELCQKFCVVSGQIYAWKKLLEENGSLIFKDKRKDKKHNETIEGLHTVIGKLVTERDFLVRVLDKSQSKKELA